MDGASKKSESVFFFFEEVKVVDDDGGVLMRFSVKCLFFFLGFFMNFIKMKNIRRNRKIKLDVNCLMV